MKKEKKCPNCSANHKYSTILCQNCRVTLKKYGTFKPNEWNKKCTLCREIFLHKSHNVKYCAACREKYRIKTYKHKRGKNKNPRFKKKNGEGTITKSGYKHITKVGHPNSSINGKIQEHTWIMSEHLKRPLAKHESVHHKNGVRHDNRIENLELWTNQQPKGQRVTDKINWCIEFLSEYGYKVITDAVV